MHWRGVALIAPLLLATALQAQDSRADYLGRFDSSGDGKVSEAEYVSYMSRSFRGLDRNGDGTLSVDELPGGHGQAITLEAFQRNLRDQFHRLDRDHHGYLDALQLTAPPR